MDMAADAHHLQGASDMCMNHTLDGLLLMVAFKECEVTTISN